MKKHFKKLLLIDLDGVLNEYNGFFKEDQIPKIRKGARDFIINLSVEYYIKIFTSRDKATTIKWLFENKLSEYVIGVTNIKEPAYLYIDDRCICFDGHYNTLLKKIDNFKVYWKQKNQSAK